MRCLQILEAARLAFQAFWIYKNGFIPFFECNSVRACRFVMLRSCGILVEIFAISVTSCEVLHYSEFNFWNFEIHEWCWLFVSKIENNLFSDRGNLSSKILRNSAQTDFFIWFIIYVSSKPIHSTFFRLFFAPKVSRFARDDFMQLSFFHNSFGHSSLLFDREKKSNFEISKALEIFITVKFHLKTIGILQ